MIKRAAEIMFDFVPCGILVPPSQLKPEVPTGAAKSKPGVIRRQQQQRFDEMRRFAGIRFN